MTHNRYKTLIENGTINLVPFISIPYKGTDFYEHYKLGGTRLDLLSQKYYNNPNYGWLILQANPELGSLEFNIDDGSLIRIPFPLDATMSQYYSDIEKYKELYGFN